MVKSPIQKAMILAAGMGTRMLPVTSKTAKPLIPVLNVANILHNLYLLKVSGIKEVILNLHHLPDSIENFLGNGEEWGMSLCYSKEETLLGTGGGVKKAASFFKEKAFILLNCDFISNIDLMQVVQFHQSHQGLATMVLTQDEARQPYFSKVGINSKNEICSFPKFQILTPNRTGIFTGIQVLTKEALDKIPNGQSDLISALYYQLMKDSPKLVMGYFAKDKYWYDTGDLIGLWESSMAMLKMLGDKKGQILRGCLAEFGGYYECKPNIWVTDETRLNQCKIIGPVMIGKGCQFTDDVVLGPNVIIGDGAKVYQKSEITNTVVLPGSVASTAHNGIWHEDTFLSCSKRI